jgi:hypothetical protein
MVVSVTASTTSGKQLSEENLRRVLGAADMALQLDADKADILRLVQLKMHHIAPNLSAAVGTEIAAKLMGVAGGLTSLSKMPACNVQVCASLPAPHPVAFAQPAHGAPALHSSNCSCNFQRGRCFAWVLCLAFEYFSCKRQRGTFQKPQLSMSGEESKCIGWKVQKHPGP